MSLNRRFCAGAVALCVSTTAAVWLSAQAGRRMRTHAEAARWLSGAVGALFVLLAARLATLERS